MNDAPDDKAEEKAEAARVRRRWLTLGEILAIVAVAISGLTLWNSYRERTNAEVEHRAESTKAERSAATLILKASPDRDGRTLALTPRLDSQTIQSQTITFPKALGLAAVDTTGDARIERSWLEAALVKARKAADAPDRTVGDARLPLLVVTRFLADGEAHVDRAVYELGYATEHAFLSGTSVKLRGLSRVGAVADDKAGQARIDALARGQLG